MFLERNNDVRPATRSELLQNLQSVTLLKVGLAAVVDIGSYLEKDGILAIDCYEEILKIRNAIAANYYPITCQLYVGTLFLLISQTSNN